jgi:hypothetical protein
LGRGKLKTKDVSEILVNHRVVVDDENPAGENGVGLHATNRRGAMADGAGSLKRKCTGCRSRADWTPSWACGFAAISKR